MEECRVDHDRVILLRVPYLLHLHFLLRERRRGGAAAGHQLFPIYFCNYMMDLLVFVALKPNKNTKFFRCVATFTAIGGIFGSLITLFSTPPEIAQWSRFQSALSHSCLLLGSLYLYVGGYIKVGVYNIIPFELGMLSCGVVGGLVELIFFAAGLESPNAMYLIHGPKELPEFQWWMFWISMSAITFAVTALIEQFTRKPEDRWYRTWKDIKDYFPIKEKKAAAAEK